MEIERFKRRGLEKWKQRECIIMSEVYYIIGTVNY